MKANLLLHYYDGEGNFIGQRFLEVKVQNQRDINPLLALLAQGRRSGDFKGSADYPLETEAYQCIERCLQEAFRHLIYPFTTMETVKSIRVMQILPDKESTT